MNLKSLWEPNGTMHEKGSLLFHFLYFTEKYNSILIFHEILPSNRLTPLGFRLLCEMCSVWRSSQRVVVMTGIIEDSDP